MTVDTTPLEKHRLTLGAVLLLLGTVAGMSMKVGMSSSTMDNMVDQIKGLRGQIEKRDADWKTDQQMIYDRIGEIKVKQEVQAAEINDLKMQLDRLRSK